MRQNDPRHQGKTGPGPKGRGPAAKQGQNRTRVVTTRLRPGPPPRQNRRPAATSRLSRRARSGQDRSLTATWALNPRAKAGRARPPTGTSALAARARPGRAGAAVRRPRIAPTTGLVTPHDRGQPSSSRDQGGQSGSSRPPLAARRTRRWRCLLLQRHPLAPQAPRGTETAPRATRPAPSNHGAGGWASPSRVPPPGRRGSRSRSRSSSGSIQHQADGASNLVFHVKRPTGATHSRGGRTQTIARSGRGNRAAGTRRQDQDETERKDSTCRAATPRSALFTSNLSRGTSGTADAHARPTWSRGAITGIPCFT